MHTMFQGTTLRRQILRSLELALHLRVHCKHRIAQFACCLKCGWQKHIWNRLTSPVCISRPQTAAPFMNTYASVFSALLSARSA